MNSILDEHASLNRINKYKLKSKFKPWITSAIQESITVKSNLLKGPKIQKIYKQKKPFDRQYKDYENMLSTLLKKSKTNYYNQYFKANMNDIKNTWERNKLYYNY